MGRQALDPQLIPNGGWEGFEIQLKCSATQRMPHDGSELQSITPALTEASSLTVVLGNMKLALQA